MNITKICGAFFLFFGLTLAASAEPWLDPGDSGIRNDIQLLSDAGVIKAPVMTWPISWADVANDVLNYPDKESLDGIVADAYENIRAEIEVAMAVGQLQGMADVQVAKHPTELRTFENTPRNSGQVEAGLRWMGESFAFRLNGQAVSNAQDNRTWRADNSYIAYIWKNQMFAISTQDRWWGPGWEGSMILSNNARPVAALTMQRNTSTPFETKWLSWIGPWTYQVIWGQLEQNRAIPNARLFAFRVDFKPLNNLEIGLSRSVIWCGAGRPCGPRDFLDILKGTSDNPNAAINDLSDQLFAIDGRWVPMPNRLPVALYAQGLAEDEAGNLPSRWTALAGIEYWGMSPISWMPGRYRVHLEFANTATEFYKDVTRFDFTYNHALYTTGYRYRGRVIGHSMDNDSEMYSFGIVLNQDKGSYWNALTRRVRLKYGGVQPNSVSTGNDDLWNFEINRGWDSPIGKLNVGVGYDLYDKQSPKHSVGRVFAEWKHEYQ